ncbi:MAG: OsmC family protein [Alphaproteobacteria bacterium]
MGDELQDGPDKAAVQVGDEKRFGIVFECDAAAAGKMRTDMHVRVLEPEQETWEFATDEGPFQGGDGTAPPPLAFFMAGLASCLITQIRNFSRRLRVDLDSLSLHTRCEWEGRMKGREPYRSAPVSFEIDIDISSPAARDEILQLVRAGIGGCFIEQTIMRENTIRHRVKLGEDWVEVA